MIFILVIILTVFVGAILEDYWKHKEKMKKIEMGIDKNEED